MDLVNAMRVASSGMKAQSERLRVVAENIANADDTAATPGGTPYRRKTISFKNELDREMGIDVVKVNKFGVDNSEFNKKYDPSHPAADEDGYVLYPNVNPISEAIDAKEAQRGYEANLNIIEVSKDMISQTLRILQ